MAAPRATPAGFEQPFEVLDACHERIQSMLRRLQWLRIHLASMGCDDQVRQAARDVIHYFDRTVPTHHEEEERHVFPPLLAAGLCVDAVARLQREHVAMAMLWPAARAVLQRLDTGDGPGFVPDDEGLLEHFTRLYDWHIAAESELVYPAAARCLDAAALTTMSEEMARRRHLR